MKRFQSFMLGAVGIATSLSTTSTTWSDAELSLLKGDQYLEYSDTEPSQKTLVTLTYASTYHNGRNFFFIDAAKVSGAGPSYADIYGEYYHTSSLSYSTGFIKDVGFTGGVNYGVKNNEFGANPEIYLLGPTVDLNLSGFVFFYIDFLAYIDNSTYTGFGGGSLCGTSATTLQITPSWKLPFTFGQHKFSFEGFMDYIGEHATCAEQLLTQPQLRWDVGLYFGKVDTVYLGIEYQYWKNKYGIRNREESVPQALLSWKF